MPENPQNMTPSGDNSKFRPLRKPGNGSVSAPRPGPPFSLDKLYKQVYYGRRIKKVLGDSDNGSEDSAALRTNKNPTYSATIR